jgi:hypothetical protein
MVEEVGYGFGVVGLCGCYWAIGGLLFRLFAIFGKIYMISRDQAGRQACLYSEILSTFQKVGREVNFHGLMQTTDTAQCLGWFFFKGTWGL